jgi:hypothetical protein
MAATASVSVAADREPVAGLVVDDAQVEGVEQGAFGRVFGVA